MNKKILITGASKGIGKAIATKLLGEGNEVIGLSRTHTIDHENYIPKILNLSDLKSLPAKLKDLAREISEIDALICNAGSWHYGNFEELSFEEMTEIVHLNFLSAVFLVKAFLPAMKTAKSGDIIFIGSESALKAPPKQSIYAASKSALRTFAKSLRSECATQNIRITIVNPGTVKTEMFAEAPFELSGDPTHTIDPGDIAELISYLLGSRIGTVLDEVNLSPQKYRLEKKSNTNPQK